MSVFFIFGTITTGSTRVFSLNEEYKIESNEYLELRSSQIMMEEISKSNINILTDEDRKYYSEIKNAIDEYPAYIYRMKELSINQLKNRNYTDEQIEAIKNYDGSENMTSLAAATVTGTYSISNYRYDSSANLTYATGNATATWQGTPFFQLVDQFAIALGAGVGNFIHQSSSCTATYKGYNSGKTFTQTPEKEVPLTTYVKFKLPRERYSSSINEAGGLIKVSGKYTAAVSNRVNIISMRPCYAHRQVSGIEGGISLSTSGINISFSVTNGYSKEWYPNAKTATL